MTMEETDAGPSRDAEAAQPDYPTPPDFQVAAWATAIGTGVVTSPHLLAKLGSPIQRSSAGPAGPSGGNAVPTQDEHDDFYRRATWAPDGSAILAVTESQQKHLLQLSSTNRLERVAELKSPSPLLDAIWYPVPAIEQPMDEPEQNTAITPTATWCFAESHRDLPIRLTSSNDGHARATYSIMNHVEKFVVPHSLAFSPDLSRLYCGLYSSLAVFPLSTPGLNTHSHIPLISGKRSACGQRGILSALATMTHPSEPGTHELVAVGTYQGTVGLYDFDPTLFPQPTEHTGMSNYDEQALAQSSCLAGWREVEGDGITQLKFHPLTPYVLFVASRRSDCIYVYDTRYLVGDTNRWNFRPLTQAAKGIRSAHLLAKLGRPGGSSHQRMYFDIDWAGRWLTTGDQDGMISLWRIDGGRFTDAGVEEEENTEAVELVPDLSWKAHEDAIGSVGFHPYRPWLISVSGSWRWPDTESSSGSESDEESDSSMSDPGDACRRRQAWTTNESSLKIWDFSQPPLSQPV